MNDGNDNYDDGGNDNTNVDRSNPNLDLGNNQNDNLSSLQSNMNLGSVAQGSVADTVTSARETAQQMLEELMKNAVDKINQNKNNSALDTSTPSQDTSTPSQRRSKPKRGSSVPPKPKQPKHFSDEYNETMEAMARMYDPFISSKASSYGPKKSSLEISQPSPQLKKMWAESRTKDRAKMQKLAELIKARRNITLAEKRKSRENTLALVRQYAQEARVKRAAAEAATAQPSQEK